MGASAVGLNRATVGLVLAGTVAIVGVGSTIAAEHRVDSEHATDLQRARTTLSQTLATRISRLSIRAQQYAEQLPRLTPSQPQELLAAAPHTDFTAMALTESALPLRVKVGDALPRALTGASSYLKDAAISARDSASPMAVVTRTSTSSYVVVLWPLYRGAIPVDTQSRRADSAGWVIGSTSVADLFATVAAPDAAFGATTSVSVTPAGPAAIAATMGSGLTARVRSVPTPSRIGVLLLGLLTLFASGALLFLTALVRRRDLGLQSGQTALSQQVELVTEVSATIQESLDVGVVLPAVLAQVSHRLNLTWIRIMTGPSAAGVELLALGRRSSLPAPRWSAEATNATAGQLVRLPLRRAMRTLGFLEFAPGSYLDEFQMTSVRQCADLLAGALHNAELYEREQDSVRRLRELDALKDDFLGTISHELRTPLSVLTGSVSLLTNNWERLPDDTRLTMVTKMQPHVASLANLVNDLLDFMTDRRATAAATLSSVQLDEEIRALAEQLRPLVHLQDLQVVAPEPVTAWTDVRALERIIGNLVGNAGKYSPAGTTIRIEVRQEPDGIVVAVSDEGAGIRPEDRDRIFERFYRGDSQAARTTRGSGIGLAVAQTWMQAVGARLEVDSQVGRGTTMAVRFPTGPDSHIDGAGTVRWQTLHPAEQEHV